jgi:tetratricopeptide (TPR) repeat protein
MKCPFEIHRRPSARLADAFLFPSHDAEPLLSLCAELDLDPDGRAFAVATGLLLSLDQPTGAACAEALRLIRLAKNLYIPVDADLAPALLDDEAEGLVRDRGLIFVPGGDVLEFDFRAPIKPGSLLLASRRPPMHWRSLPEPPRLADQIEEIVIELPGASPGLSHTETPDELPDEAADSVLEAGGEGIGTAEPRPAPSSPAAKMLGRGALGAGQWMMKLGGWLGLPGVAAVGSAWARRAIDLAPRLSEDVLGRQAAALRELLREFREGDSERALRHALPISAPGGPRGSSPATTHRLPTHETQYSLKGLLGANDRGPANVWLGGTDMMAELAREYERLAEIAVKEGDFRRAAFIYGKLLHDYRKAAHTLLRGGLYRDAAVIFLAKLDDPLAAARAFESAGEIDRALHLYRRAGEHESAGDLLKRIGEDEAAVQEYLYAADRLINSGAGHLAAGDLLRNKAGRDDLAVQLFRAGWARRPDGNAFPCAFRLAHYIVEAGNSADLRSLIDEADEIFALPGRNHEAREFYNEVAHLADEPLVAEIREELRDRCLIGLATKTLRRIEAGTNHGALVSEMFGRSRDWPAIVVRDAEFATALAARQHALEPTVRRFHAKANVRCPGTGHVTAACSAARSGVVFLGFDGGEIYGFLPSSSVVVSVVAQNAPVIALATDDDGRWLVALTGSPGRGRTLTSYEWSSEGAYRHVLALGLGALSTPWLTPVFEVSGDALVGAWLDSTLVVMSVGTMTHHSSMKFSADHNPSAALAIPTRSGGGYDILRAEPYGWVLAARFHKPDRPTGLNWRPIPPSNQSLRSAPVSSNWRDPDHLELAGLGNYGTIYWGLLHRGEDSLSSVASGSSGERGGYHAVTIAQPGVLAGVSPTRIDSYRCSAGRLVLHHSEPIQLDVIAACFHCRWTHELIVIRAEGSIHRFSLSGA